MNVAASAILPGFGDAVIESQRVFRRVLDAMARPGTVTVLPDLPQPPAPIDPAAGAILLALADQDTPVWLDRGESAPEIAAWLSFHCGSRIVPQASQAAFALITDPMTMPPLDVFPLGSEEYPDRSATVIVQVPSLTGGPTLVLSGPGIRDRMDLAPLGLPAAFKAWLIDNNVLFPCGVDLIFASGNAVTAVPRSTRVRA